MKLDDAKKWKGEVVGEVDAEAVAVAATIPPELAGQPTKLATARRAAAAPGRRRPCRSTHIPPDSDLRTPKPRSTAAL
jgi:hypothetical protein